MHAHLGEYLGVGRSRPAGRRRGRAVDPQVEIDAFCGASAGGSDDWVSAGHHVTIDVGAGSHTIEVRGQLQSGVAPTDLWWIGDLSLSVIGEEY